MQLVRVNSRSLMNFFVGILQTLVKLVQVEILELMTRSATGTGMLVKRALTSNETMLLYPHPKGVPSLLGLSTQKTINN